MKIIRRKAQDGSSVWTTTTNNAHIRHSPAKAGSVTDPYVLARIGDGEFYCEDNNDFVYRYQSLLNGDADAPAYMKRLARRVRKDLAADAKEVNQ